MGSTVLLVLALPLARITLVPAVRNVGESLDVELPVLSRWVIQTPAWAVAVFVVWALGMLAVGHFVVKLDKLRIAFNLVIFLLAVLVIGAHILGLVLVMVASYRDLSA